MSLASSAESIVPRRAARPQPCLTCAQLELRLQMAQQELQRLSHRLAEARARADALFRAYPPQGGAPLPTEASAASALGSAWEAQGTLGSPPLRHRLVDSLNRRAKAAMPPVVHRLLRAAATHLAERR